MNLFILTPSVNQTLTMNSGLTEDFKKKEKKKLKDKEGLCLYKPEETNERKRLNTVVSISIRVI